MTNELSTRRLIVTLPDTSGDEADEYAAHLEVNLMNNLAPDATVTHALGESLPDGVEVETAIGHDTVTIIRQGNQELALPDALAARQLAGVLLRLAHDLDPNQEA